MLILSESISSASTETYLTLSQAAKTLPRINGRKVHSSTLWRWARRGYKGIRLQYYRIGRTIMTSETALQQFFSAVAKADTSPTQHTQIKPPIRKRRRRPADRQASIEQANTILRNAGILV